MRVPAPADSRVLCMSGPHDGDGKGDPVGPDEPFADADGPEPDGVDGLDDAAVAERWAGIVSDLAGPSDPRAWAPDPKAEEAENHFVPPDPGPVLGGDPLLTMAWTVVAAVPLLMLVSVVWRAVPTIVLQGAGACFVVAIGLLLWRMPRDHEDDGPGAVV